MMEWTDRHCRFFHRLLSPHARLYTEMVTTGALLHGDVAHHLRFHENENPLALQLGGSEPRDLAHCARLAQQWGYDEINLNCGCPSERVQRGAFGACLMAEPQLVAQCVSAMIDAVQIPITVKHRIGIDQQDSYEFVRDFVGQVSLAGCQVFIVHARNAWLKGLSPKQNREVPPLRYDLVYHLKRDFPHLTIVLNGGLTETVQIRQVLEQVDGVMIGREAYHHPYKLALWEAEFFSADTLPMRTQIMEAMAQYAKHEQRLYATPLRCITKHILGLYSGLPGARAFRRLLSNSNELKNANYELLYRALQLAQLENPIQAYEGEI
jgi:tRNA-dihydrouridine synthase A